MDHVQQALRQHNALRNTEGDHLSFREVSNQPPRSTSDDYAPVHLYQQPAPPRYDNARPSRSQSVHPAARPEIGRQSAERASFKHFAPLRRCQARDHRGGPLLQLWSVVCAPLTRSNLSFAFEHFWLFATFKGDDFFSHPKWMSGAKIR